MARLETARLILRPFRQGDLEAFARLNADPAVMAHFPAPLSRTESDALAARVFEHFDRHGYGPWAVEVKDGTGFIGFTGLSRPGFDAHFTPCVEVGWRIAAAEWGKGYATEAARAALRYGFRELALSQIVAFTVPANLRSRRVMEKLGMTHDPREDFDHPSLPAGHPLQRHALYRIARQV